MSDDMIQLNIRISRRSRRMLSALMAKMAADGQTQSEFLSAVIEAMAKCHPDVIALVDAFDASERETLAVA
jgi:hypothetical protein